MPSRWEVKELWEPPRMIGQTGSGLDVLLAAGWEPYNAVTELQHGEFGVRGTRYFLRRWIDDE